MRGFRKVLVVYIIFAFITVNFLQAREQSSVSYGYADLHVHMFANLGFAGGWFTGDPTASTKDQMFKFCQKEESRSWFYQFIHKIDPYLGSFIYRDACIPPSEKESFPQWNNLAHQQVWQEDLKRAHENGLSLMILSAVHSYVLCRLLRYI